MNNIIIDALNALSALGAAYSDKNNDCSDIAADYYKEFNAIKNCLEQLATLDINTLLQNNGLLNKILHATQKFYNETILTNIDLKTSKHDYVVYTAESNDRFQQNQLYAVIANMPFLNLFIVAIPNDKFRTADIIYYHQGHKVVI